MKKIVTILMKNAERIAVFSISISLVVGITLLCGFSLYGGVEESYRAVALDVERQPEVIDNAQNEDDTQEDMTVYDEAALAYINHMTLLDCSMMYGMAPVDLEQWYIEYKEIISEYEYYLNEPNTIYDYYTEKELDLLFKVVQAEAGDECSFEQKTHVASVILNRLSDARFPDSIFDVLTKDQFQCIADGRYKKVTVSDITILSTEFAFEIMDTTYGCLFFDSNNTLSYQFAFNDGVFNLYRLKE